MNTKTPPNNHIPDDIICDSYLIELAKSHSSPLYVYDKNIIKSRWEKIKSNFKYQLFYSVKSNPFNEVINLFNSLNAYFEVTSYGELLKLKENDISLSKSLFVGPAKIDKVIKFSIENNIGLIAVESKNEYIRINRIATELKKNVNLLLRVNPKFNAGAMINISGITQFGMEKDVVLEILNDSKRFLNTNIIGLHFYLGTNILDAKQIISNIQNILYISQEIENKTQAGFELIDIGCGFGIPYYEQDTAIDIDYLSSEINNIIYSYTQKNKITKFAMEFGRFLVGEAGIFITQVIDIKVSFGKKFIMLDGGTNFFGGDNRYRGFKFTPIKILNSKNEEKEVVTLVGPLCTASDVLANNIFLSKVEIGDYIAFYQAGAYSFTASPILFLSHSLPKEVLT